MIDAGQLPLSKTGAAASMSTMGRIVKSLYT